MVGCGATVKPEERGKEVHPIVRGSSDRHDSPCIPGAANQSLPGGGSSLMVQEAGHSRNQGFEWIRRPSRQRS